MTWLISSTLALVCVLMLLEARRSRANERALRARGAVEPPGDVYRLMAIAYPTGFVTMAIEGWVRAVRPGLLFWTGAAVFVLAKALKYRAIAALGPFWSFRVLVVPGAPLVTTGPYRLLRHPNYVAVAGELVGVALMMASLVVGALSIIGFGLIMLRRIAVEERALGLRV